MYLFTNRMIKHSYLADQVVLSLDRKQALIQESGYQLAIKVSAIKLHLGENFILKGGEGEFKTGRISFGFSEGEKKTGRIQSCIQYCKSNTGPPPTPTNSNLQPLFRCFFKIKNFEQLELLCPLSGFFFFILCFEFDV